MPAAHEAEKEVVAPEYGDDMYRYYDPARGWQQKMDEQIHDAGGGYGGGGYKLATNGTENHLMLWDLRPLGLTGSKVEKVFEEIHITLNKNAVHGDVSAMAPGGVRIGAPAMTSRGLKEDDFKQIGDFLHRGLLIAKETQEKSGKKLADFLKALKEKEATDKLEALKAEVEAWAGKFPMPGH